MTEENFNKLSKEEQARISSEFRKTVHDGEIVFLDNDEAKRLAQQDIKEILLKQKQELLASLGLTTNDEKTVDYPRRSR